MARRSDHTRDEIKEMALEAGNKAIVEEGFQDFSIRKVAKKIGYTVGTLYNVFENYNDLLFHINAITLDKITDLVKSNLSEDMDDLEALKSIGSTYLEYAISNRNRWIALVEYQRPERVEIPEWYQKKVDDAFAISIKYILPFVDNNLEKAVDVSRILWGGVHGICILGLSGRIGNLSNEKLRYKVDNLIENYIFGLRTLKNDKVYEAEVS